MTVLPKLPHPLRCVAVAAAVLGLLAGCESGGSEDRNQAAERYMKARSTMALQLAERQFDSQDLDSAEKTLNDALKVNAKDGRVYLMLGRIALERGQLERAFRHFELSIELDEQLHGAHYFKGVIHQRWQQYDKALASYNRAFELWRDKPTYLLAIAEMLIELDRADEALKLLESKLVYFDQNAGIRLAIGQVHLLRDDPASALRYYQQAALLSPEDKRLREELAHVQVRAGETAAAARGLESLMLDESYAERSDLRLLLADCLLKLNRPAEATKLLTELTQREPALLDSWLKLGEAAWAAGDSATALRATGKARQLAPDRADGYLLAGIIWSKQGDVDEAVRMFDAAAQLAPQDHLPMLLRGVALEQVGRPSAAEEAYREALRRKPDDERTRRLLAGVMARKP